MNSQLLTNNNQRVLGRLYQASIEAPQTKSMTGEKSTATVNKSDGGKAQFQCSTCNVQYYRIDHLVRHVRTHTNQRPYACRICSKAFARQDLMKRHEASHDNAGFSARVARRNSRTSDRVPRACKQCASKKLKCTGESPCERCRTKEEKCEYAKQIHQHQTSTMGPSTPTSSETNSTSIPEETHTLVRSESAPQPIAMAPPERPLITAQDEPMHDMAFGTDFQQFGPNDLLTMDLFSDPLNFCAIGETSEHISPGAAWNLQASDFEFLDSMNNRWIPEPPKRTNGPMFAMGSKAFQNASSTRLWEPSATESCDLERSNLALADGTESLPNQSPLGEQPFVECMSFANRDRILQMILSVSSDSSAAKVLASFPSPETLTNLIMNYVYGKKPRHVSDFIHLPTLDLNKQRPEFLAALVAMGAVEAVSPAVRSFGYAMQEVVRLSILRRFESDNSTMRDIGVCQAFFLQQHIAFFSGVRRKIDLAEGCSMAGGVLFASLSAMLRTDDSTDNRYNIDDETRLHNNWQLWAKKESMRRLVYFIYSLDAHVSMARSRPAHISCNQMNMGLPSPQALWLAKDATQWREAVIASSLSLAPIPSLRQLMQDPSRLAANQSNMDVQFAQICVICGLWSLVWECRQLSQLGLGSPFWNPLLITSRIDELYSALQLCSNDSILPTASRYRVEILHQITSMHLHVSFQDLVTFAGEETENERAGSLSYAENWIDTKGCQTALWHAGQTIRAASEFPPSSIDDIYITCVFQAAVILWTYGVFLRTRSEQHDFSTALAQPRGDFFVLNNIHEKERSRLPIRHRGQAALLDWEGKIFTLDKPAMTMDLVAGLLLRNWQNCPMPRYAEEVARILLDLGKIVR